MDEITKYRITGAAIWLLLLIILVPSWYSNPVEDPSQKSWAKTVAYADEIDDLLLEEAPVNKEVVKELAEQPIKQVAAPEVVKEEAKQEIITPQVVEKPIEKPVAKSVEQPKPAKPSEEWQIRVATYKSLQTAKNTLALLEDRYQVTIGDFSAGDKKMFTVRVGPYPTKEQAMKVKQDLDIELRTDSAIIKIR